MQTVYFFDATANAENDYTWRIEQPIVILGILQCVGFLSGAGDCQVGLFMGTKTLNGTIVTTDDESSILACLIAMSDFESATGVSVQSHHLYIPMYYRMEAGQLLHRFMTFQAGSPTSVRAQRIVYYEKV